MLVFQEEEKMLYDSAQELLSTVCPVSNQRTLRDSNSTLGFDPQVWQQIIDMGWTAIPFDEDIGGLDFSYKGLTAIFEQIGRNLSATPLLSQVALVGTALERHATKAIKNKYLPELISGTKRFVLALDERMFHDLTQVESTLKQENGEFVINGQKAIVIDGNEADYYVVVTRQEDSYAFALVESNTPGLKVTPLKLIDSRNYAVISLENAILSQEQIINSDPVSLEQLQSVLDVGRVCLSAEILGACETLFGHTIEYLKTRIQFDAPIGSFQALQHRAAWLFTELELARSCVLKAALCLDEFKTASTSYNKVIQEISLAMYKVSVMADKVSSEAIQLHGGIGVTDELDLGLFLKRIRVAQTLLGDRDFMQLRYSNTIL